MEKYWLEMNARQLRPQAHEAFRLGKYREAVEHYRQIQSLLSPAELKKLAIAEERSNVEVRLGQQLLGLAVLALQLFEPVSVRRVHPHGTWRATCKTPHR